ALHRRGADGARALERHVSPDETGRRDSCCVEQIRSGAVLAMAAKKKTIRTIPQERTPAREQDPRERARNFLEVSLGYRLAGALVEDQRRPECAGAPRARACAGGH